MMGLDLALSAHNFFENMISDLSICFIIWSDITWAADADRQHQPKATNPQVQSPKPFNKISWQSSAIWLCEELGDSKSTFQKHPWVYRDKEISLTSTNWTLFRTPSSEGLAEGFRKFLLTSTPFNLSKVLCFSEDFFSNYFFWNGFRYSSLNPLARRTSQLAEKSYDDRTSPSQAVMTLKCVGKHQILHFRHISSCPFQE